MNWPEMADERRKTQLKLVVVGDPGCGKTSLLSVFGKSRFPDPSRYTPTIYDSDGLAYLELACRQPCVKVGPCFRFGGVQETVFVELQLWDTGGHEELDRFRRLSYPEADVVLVCFAVDDPVSFANVADKWVPEVRHFCGDVPVLLVATKRDLCAELKPAQRRFGKNKSGAVEREAMDKLARSLGARSCLECSAKCNQGVHEVFVAATKAALKSKRNQKCKLYPIL